MNKIIALSIAAIIVAVGVWFALSSQNDTQTQAENAYTADTLGIKFDVPDGWITEDVGSTLRLKSPDYTESAPPSGYEAIGNSFNPVTKGVLISIHKDTNAHNESVDDYVQRELSSDVGNLIDNRKLNLSGNSAVLQRVEHYDYGDWTQIKTIYQGSEFRIVFAYPTFSPDVERVIADFIDSFQFTR